MTTAQSRAIARVIDQFSGGCCPACQATNLDRRPGAGVYVRCDRCHFEVTEQEWSRAREEVRQAGQADQKSDLKLFDEWRRAQDPPSQSFRPAVEPEVHICHDNCKQSAG